LQGALSIVAVGAALLFVIATPFIWRKLVHPLERIGWVIGIVASGLTIITFVIPELPNEGQYGVGALAAVVLGVTAYWSRRDKNTSHIHEATENIPDRGKPQRRRLISTTESNLDDLIREI
jgi:hypothetical protein